MRERLCCREKSFFKDILACFLLSLSFLEWGSFNQKGMTPFLQQIASHFRRALGTAITLYLLALFHQLSMHISAS